MRDGRGKLYMSHTLSAHFGARNFYAALVAHNALVAYSFILTAMALPVLGGTKNSFAEKAVLFGLLRAVVYGFGFGNLAVRPLADFIGTRNGNLHGIEII